MRKPALLLIVCAACFTLSGSAQQGIAQAGFLEALAGAVVTFSPKGDPAGSISASDIRIAPDEWIEIGQAVAETIDVMQRSAVRRRKHLAKLKARGIEEEPMSSAGIAFEIEALGNRFAFDRYGYLHFDDRFVRPAERKALERIESIYRRLHSRWLAAQEAKARKSGKKPVRAATIADRAAEWRVRRVPVFKGFEDDRYQEHDGLIVRCVDEFNRNRAEWAGATPGQAKRIPAITTALVKSLLIEETGGRDAKSKAAWDADPGQVNVPGDWSEAKKSIGLSKPSKRNEGTPDGNIRAAIKFLVRKGFGVSGQAASRRPTGVFDDWRTALCRYNGRDDEMIDGRSYRETYADHIVERAKDPGRFVAIRKRKKQ